MPEVLENRDKLFNPEDYLSISKAIEKLIIYGDLRIEKSKISYKYNWTRCAEGKFSIMNRTYSDYCKKI